MKNIIKYQNSGQNQLIHVTLHNCHECLSDSFECFVQLMIFDLIMGVPLRSILRSRAM